MNTIISSPTHPVYSNHSSFPTTPPSTLHQLYKEDLQDLLVSASKREKDQVVIRDDVGGGIKVALLSSSHPFLEFKHNMKIFCNYTQGYQTCVASELSFWLDFFIEEKFTHFASFSSLLLSTNFLLPSPPNLTPTSEQHSPPPTTKPFSSTLPVGGHDRDSSEHV